MRFSNEHVVFGLNSHTSTHFGIFLEDFSKLDELLEAFDAFHRLIALFNALPRDIIGETLAVDIVEKDFENVLGTTGGQLEEVGAGNRLVENQPMNRNLCTTKY